LIGSLSHLHGYIDRISCIYLHNLPFLCTTLKTIDASLGCFVNPAKTQSLTSCNGQSTLPLLQTTNPELANAISATIVEFSTFPHPTNESAHPLPVEFTTGFSLLGHPVGSHTFAAKFFSSHINNMKECITFLSHHITNKLTKLKLFSQ
jgi:hypothetical protein